MYLDGKAESERRAAMRAAFCLKGAGPLLQVTGAQGRGGYFSSRKWPTSIASMPEE